MQFDPRTVARNIPGVFDEVFPQLTPGVVAYFNKSEKTFPILPIRPDLLQRSTLQRAMLFELGYTVGETLLGGAVVIDWPICFAETLRRQRVYFDAVLPDQLSEGDQLLAETVGKNIAATITKLTHLSGRAIVIRPQIPGLEWIANGYGDFSLGSTLIEVKCTAKRFSAADYRQIAIYWLLSFAASIEGHGEEWQDFVLLNPRSGMLVSMEFDSFLAIISSGRTKVEILQLFQSLVGTRLTR